MGLFNVDWNNSSGTHRHTTHTTRTTRPSTAKPSFLSRLFGSSTRSKSRTRSRARPGPMRRSRPSNTGAVAGGTTTRRRTTWTRHTHGVVPGTPSTGRSNRSTALGQPRRRTGLFDSMLGRSRHRQAHTTSRATGSRKLAPAPVPGKAANRPWLHPKHQRAPTPHTGLGDKVVGTVTGNGAKRRRGERKEVWARNVREEERGWRGRPVYA